MRLEVIIHNFDKKEHNESCVYCQAKLGNLYEIKKKNQGGLVIVICHTCMKQILRFLPLNLVIKGL